MHDWKCTYLHNTSNLIHLAPETLPLSPTYQPEMDKSLSLLGSISEIAPKAWFNYVFSFSCNRLSLAHFVTLFFLHVKWHFSCPWFLLIRISVTCTKMFAVSIALWCCFETFNFNILLNYVAFRLQWHLTCLAQSHVLRINM